MPSSSQRRGPIRKLIFASVATVIGLALLEGLAAFAWTGVELYSLWMAAPKVAELKEQFHCQYDAEIGWVHKPQATLPDFYGPGASITIDERGLRSHALLDGVREQNAKKVVCLGDSFTLGYGVDDQQTFPFLFEEKMSGSVQVFNMGQGGYSIGQNWLWLKRMLPELQPQLVVGVFIVEDFRRLGVVQTANGYSVPQFVVENERVQVRGTPVAQKLETGQTYFRVGDVSRAFNQNLSLARTLRQFVPQTRSQTNDDLLVDGLYVIREIVRICQRNDCEFKLVLTPVESEIYDPGFRTEFLKVEKVLTNFSASEGIDFFSLIGAFEDKSDQALFLDEQFRHYSKAGNRLVAEQLHKWLPTVSDVFPSE